MFSTRAPEENARLAGKPVVGAAAAVANVARRALGEIAGVNVASRPGTRSGVPVVPAAAGAGAEAQALAEMDVDSADVEDPAAVSEYVADIYNFYRSVESTRCASNTYMKTQSDVNEKMRAILIDWLIEVHLKFKLMPETLHLTVNIIDRFLEKKQVIRQKLQLVGVTAMLLASKYEEIYAPEVRDFVYITDKAYTKEQILAMEATILNTLEFRITVPTAYVFLNRYLKVANAHTDVKIGYFATFLAERMLQEFRMLSYTPSKVAAAAVNVALRTFRGRTSWDRKVEVHSGFRQEDLRACIKDMEEISAGASANSLKAVSKKYALPKFGEVSTIAPIGLE